MSLSAEQTYIPPSSDERKELSDLKDYLLTSCFDCPLHVEVAKLHCENAYRRKMHQKALEREERLKEEIAELKAKLRLREST